MVCSYVQKHVIEALEGYTRVFCERSEQGTKHFVCNELVIFNHGLYPRGGSGIAG